MAARAGALDMVWIMESSEHFHDKPGFFERCARALKPGGVSRFARGSAAMDRCAKTNSRWSTPLRKRCSAPAWTRSAIISIGCATPA